MTTLLSSEVEQSSLDTTPVRIVIVDDHELLRNGLRTLLARRPESFQVVGEAGTASDGYALVGKTLPDLVVLDLNLPDQNGARLTGAIRAAWPRDENPHLIRQQQPASFPGSCPSRGGRVCA